MIIAGILAFAALAEMPTKAEIGAQSSVAARQGMAALGQCVVSERTLEARAVLAMDFREKSYGNALRKVLNAPAECPGMSLPKGAFGSGTLLWGGALAEGLLRRDQILDDLAGRTAYRPDLPDIEARNAGELMAFCTVRKDPAMTAALLRTEPATEPEYNALKAIGPTLSACVPANSKSAFTRESLRALLALAAQRLATFNQQASR